MQTSLQSEKTYSQLCYKNTMLIPNPVGFGVNPQFYMFKKILLFILGITLEVVLRAVIYIQWKVT